MRLFFVPFRQGGGLVVSEEALLADEVVPAGVAGGVDEGTEGELGDWDEVGGGGVFGEEDGYGEMTEVVE